MGKNILIVDDEIMIRNLYSTILKNHDGYYSIQAEDGESAVAKLKEYKSMGQPLDLVITDCDILV